MRTLGLAIALTLILAAPAAASFGDDSFVAFSSPDDPVSQGVPALSTSLSVSGFASDVHVQAIGSFLNRSFNLHFASRPGTVLSPGLYKDFSGSNKPRMDIASSAGSCTSPSGWFEVKDISTDPVSGAVQRLQVLFEQHCDGAAPALFGEVRIGEPVAGTAVATPSELVLPDTSFGAPTYESAVALIVTQPMSITGVSIGGRDAGDFSQTAVNCSGSCPNPNGPFSSGDVAGVGITYAPVKVGKSTATLQVTDSTGGVYTVPLRASTSR